MNYDEGIKRGMKQSRYASGVWRLKRKSYKLVPCSYCGAPCFLRKDIPYPNSYCSRVCFHKAKSSKYVTSTHKKCSRCQKWKLHVEFSRRTNTKGHGTFLSECKECSRVITQERRLTPDGHKYMQEYTKSSTRKMAVKRHNTKKRSTPKGSLDGRMSTAMSRGMRRGKEGRSWKDLVGYTLQELMEHLESRFTEGMSWGNRSEWHIDHIRPLSSFNYESPDDPEFGDAWALDNLQPLWAEDNLRKGANLN